MTDDRPDAAEGPDRRDAELAEALGVPPLDDVTRRRLVRNALDGGERARETQVSPAKRSRVPLVVAAAVVVLLVVVGIVTLGRAGDDSSTDTAARKPDRASSAAAPEASATSGDTAARGTGASSATGVTTYGDFGDLSSPSARDAARAKVGTPLAAADAGNVSEALVARIADAACAAPLRADRTTVVGVGTATVHGHDAAVVVTQGADGTRSTHLLVFDPCTLTRL